MRAAAEILKFWGHFGRRNFLNAPGDSFAPRSCSCGDTFAAKNRGHRRYGSVALAGAAVAIFVLGFVSALVFTRPAKADGNPANLNPAAIAYQLPDQLKWVTQPNGAINAVLRGDPSKPGPYIVLTKWTAHHMSRPHFHPNDRFVMVLSGTWWVGTGRKYDPDSTVPLPPGTFATHYGKQIHYDGAKDEDVVLEIVGEGPATQVAAEDK